MKALAPLLGLLLASALAAGAQTTHKVYDGRIMSAGVSGGAFLRGKLLLTAEGTNGLTLLDDAMGRLRSGTVSPRPEEALAPALQGKVDLEDLEDAAWDGARDLYVVASHSRTARGDSPESRYRLARLRFDATGKLLEARQLDALLQAIVNDVPFLADSIRRTPARAGLNIEGLAWDPSGRLVIGLRAPTITESTKREHGGQEDAVVLRLKNPDTIFAQLGQPAAMGDVVKLDLHGQGIRGMAYDPRLKSFWVVSGLSAEPGYAVKSPWNLWLWKGEQPPRRARLPEGLDLEQPETVTPVEVEGQPYLLLIDEGRPSSPYALIPAPEVAP